MKTVIIEYEKVNYAPLIFASVIENSYNCTTKVKDIDEDYFEISIYGCQRLAELEDFLSEFV